MMGFCWSQGSNRLAVALASLCGILMPSASHADDASMAKYRDWLPGQILEMPEKQRRSEVPIAYIMSARTADLAIQSFLNTLMYNGIADFEGAKRRFQGDLGEPQTGALTVGQITDLSFRAERMHLTSVAFFPFKFGGEIYEENAQVRGTAKILGENIAHPVNYVEIDCRKIEGTCNYRQFVMTLPKKMDWSQSYTVMESFNEVYKITRWEDDRIDASPIHEGKCRIPELRLNFASDEFYEITTNAPEGKCDLPLGGSLPKLDKPRISQIVDGDPIAQAEFDKIKNETFQYLSSEFRSRIDKEFKSDRRDK